MDQNVNVIDIKLQWKLLHVHVAPHDFLLNYYTLESGIFHCIIYQTQFTYSFI